MSKFLRNGFTGATPVIFTKFPDTTPVNQKESYHKKTLDQFMLFTPSVNLLVLIFVRRDVLNVLTFVFLFLSLIQNVYVPIAPSSPKIIQHVNIVALPRKLIQVENLLFSQKRISKIVKTMKSWS